MNELNNTVIRQLRLVGEQMSKSIKKSLESARPSLTQLQARIVEYDFPSLLPYFEELGEMLKKAGDVALKYKSIIVELGYPPHREVPVEYVRDIVHDYDKYGKEYVAKYIDELMFDYYDEQLVSEMSLKWENKNLAKSRIHILRNAIKCHNQMMYDASIPTILPQIEGIIAEAFGHVGNFNGYHIKVYLKNLLNKNLSENDLSLKDALYEYYVQNLLVKFEHGKEIMSDVSRHAILHGGDKNYGKQSNSLKLILLFDFLITVLNDVSEEVIQEAKEEINQ
ncbi:hypothetical protein P4640_27430 [Priestia aryabhattai]|uniref:hypothetical protein n=1 Tax=Priestia aryabhattai TaxID=412384 RepID=UPI002E1E3054|nr:hypothetical protein [Priestia aryabhattai]